MGPFEGHFTGMTFFVFVLGFPNLRRALASLGTLKRSCGWWMLGLYAAVGRRYLWHGQLVLPLMSHWRHGNHAAERQALVLLPLRTFEVVYACWFVVGGSSYQFRRSHRSSKAALLYGSMRTTWWTLLVIS
jgi:hypothetical protein